MNLKPIPGTLEKAINFKILNSNQRQVFDRVLGHCLQLDKPQLLSHMDGVAGTGKSKCIELVFSHMTHRACQKKLDLGT